MVLLFGFAEELQDVDGTRLHAAIGAPRNRSIGRRLLCLQGLLFHNPKKKIKTLYIYTWWLQ